MSGRYASRETALAAIRFAEPLVQAALLDASMGQSGVAAIVIMDPTKGPNNSTFEDAILLEHAFGKERNAWDADYFYYARGKAYLSWRTRLDSGLVQRELPQLVQENDIQVWGSVALQGIVVAVSGFEAWMDEAIAGSIAMCFRGLMKGQAAAPSPTPSPRGGGNLLEQQAS